MTTLAQHERARKALEKRKRREEREADLAARQTALPTKRYGVILADPEWRFEPWSRVVWSKDRVGTGYWFRNRHELLLIGVRGDIPAPAPGTQSSSVIEAPVGAHSAKPQAFLELIERYFPNLPKIELNRRGAARPGWDAWGLEAAIAGDVA